MNKSENILAFETALKESKELQAKFAAAQKRIVENKEASSDGEVLVKAAAEIGFTLSMAELERCFAQSEELSDEDLDKVAGGVDNGSANDTWCVKDYACYFVYKHDSTNKLAACFSDYNCFQFYNH